MTFRVGRRLLPLVAALAALGIAAPAALADTETGPIDVHISDTAPTSGMAQTGNTWAPDGSADPAILSVSDLDDSLSGQTGTIVISSTSTATTGTAGTDPGNIDIDTDPGDASGDVEFLPADGGTIEIDSDSGGVTLDQQEYNGPVELNADTTFDSTTSTTFDSTVDGAVNLTLNGPTTFEDIVGGTTALTSLTAAGPVQMSESGGQITTSGAQDYEDNVELDEAQGELVSTGSGNITFESTITAPAPASESSSLILETDGITTFGGTVTGDIYSLTSSDYTDGGSGTTVINTGSIAIADYGYLDFANAVQLGADLDISEDSGAPTGGHVSFDSTLDSASGSSYSLTDTIPDAVDLNGTVGGTTRLSSVDLDDAAIAADVDTAGAQTYGSASLDGTPTLSATNGGAITFTNAISGHSQDTLTTHAGGTTSVENGASGFDSLTITGPASLGGAIHTGGGQTYDGNDSLSAATDLVADSGNIDAIGTVDLGNYNLTVQGNADFSAAISGDGSLDLGSQEDSASAPAETIELAGDNQVFLGETTIDGTNSLLEFTGSDNFGTGGLSIADGGGIEWAPGNTTDISNLLPPIGPGGAAFDTNGNDVTFGTPLTDEAAGQSGTITKEGAGELTLTGDNTLDEPWDVTGGTLGLTGTLAGKVTVGSSGALSCDTGTLSGGLVNDGGTVSSMPDTPTNVTATAGTGQASVSFTPGASHCSPFTGYEVTAEPGNIHATGSGSPITVSGLRGGTTYTFTVTATNVIGTSAASTPSNAVTTSRLVYATIASPSSGQTYTVGQKVTTTFSCAALISGGLTSCRDSNGATSGSGQLNTSKAGSFTYVVTAIGSDGSTSTASISYTVVLPSNQFTLSGIKTKAKGVVTFSVEVPDAGALGVSETAGKTKLASAKLKSKGATTLHVRLTLTARERKKIGKSGLKATLTLTFTPTGGKARTVKHSGVRLKR